MSQNFYEAYPYVNHAVPAEPIVNRFAREVGIQWACQSGNFMCQNDTYILTHVYADHDRHVPKGLEDAVYCNGLKGENRQEEWLEMWQKMKESTDGEQRSQIIRSLGCLEDQSLLKAYLQSSIGTNSDNNYSNSERYQVFQSVLSSSVSVAATIDFIKSHEQDGIAIR